MDIIDNWKEMDISFCTGDTCFVAINADIKQASSGWWKRLPLPSSAVHSVETGIVSSGLIDFLATLSATLLCDDRRWWTFDCGASASRTSSGSSRNSPPFLRPHSFRVLAVTRSSVQVGDRHGIFVRPI